MTDFLKIAIGIIAILGGTYMVARIFARGVLDEIDYHFKRKLDKFKKYDKV